MSVSAPLRNRATAPAQSRGFAHGHVRWQVDVVDGRSASTTASASYPLSLLVPRGRDDACWAYLASHGGGMVSGDQVSIATGIGPGAMAYLGTQSVGKVYRSLHDHTCVQQVEHRIAAGALLVYAPDAVSCFAKARYRQTLDYELALDASVVACDGFLAGREARGEFWDFSELSSRTQISINGEVQAIDHIRLHGTSTARRMAGYGVFASILALGPLSVPAVKAGLEALPQIRDGGGLLVSSGPCAGGHLFRVAGRHHAQLTAFLQLILEPLAGILGGRAWLRRP